MIKSRENILETRLHSNPTWTETAEGKQGNQGDSVEARQRPEQQQGKLSQRPARRRESLVEIDLL